MSLHMIGIIVKDHANHFGRYVFAPLERASLIQEF